MNMNTSMAESNQAVSPALMSINQVAQMGILPAYTLRQLQREGRLPGIALRHKYLVNLRELTARIENGTL